MTGIPDLDFMINMAHEHAKKTLIGKARAELLPTFVLFAPAGDSYELTVVACPWRNTVEKEAMIATVKATAHLIGAKALSVVSEAWVATYKRAEWEEGADPPSQRSNRVEVVFVVATDGTTKKFKRWRIRRDRPGGPVRALLLEDSPLDDGNFSGRLVDDMLPA